VVDAASGADPARRRETKVMAENLKKGDRVAWKTSQGETRGRVEKQQTSDTQIKGHTVRASDDDPQYIVRSEKSGRKAAHRPDALRKL
jgi:hypothetical protein